MRGRSTDPKDFQLRDHFADFIVATVGEPMAQIAERHKEGSHSLTLVVGGDHHARSLVRAEQLWTLADEDGRLGAVPPELPSCIAVDRSKEALDFGELAALGLSLAETAAPGLIVTGEWIDGYGARIIEGLIDVDDVAGALTYRMLGEHPTESAGRRSGASWLDAYRQHLLRLATPVRMYRCRFDGTVLLPREGGQAPECPVNFTHGLMEPV